AESGQRSVVELPEAAAIGRIDESEEPAVEIEELTEDGPLGLLGTPIEDGSHSAQLGEAGVAGVLVSPAAWTETEDTDVDTVSDTTAVMVE
ncbi:hypothetical protein C1X57_30150, partial [Pseudomonas sp. FW215-E1]